MDDVSIALDLEGVLADVHNIALDYTDELTEEDFETFLFEDDRLEELLDTFEYIWRNEWPNIPPTEDDLGEKVNDLRRHGTVDLVTNTPGPRERVLDWLDEQGIELDGYVFPGPGHHKHELDYEIYVDDNPYMPGDEGVEILYFYTQPYNEDFNGDYFLDVDDPAQIAYYDLSADDPMVLNPIQPDIQTVVRVDSLTQVHADLAHRRVDGEIAI